MPQTTYESKRNAQLVLLTSPAIVTGTFANAAGVTAAVAENAIPGVNDFGYDHQLDIQVRGKGQFGKNRPVGLTDEYGGIKGSFDIEGVTGSNAALAALSRQARASLVTASFNRLQEFFAFCNVTDDSGTILKSHFLETCRVDGTPVKVGPDARRFSFQGVFAREFVGKRVRMSVIGGNATPVTAFSYPTGETAANWTDDMGASRYALLVMRLNGADGAVKVLDLAATAADGLYSETASAITLAAADGLTASDKLLVAYLV